MELDVTMGLPARNDNRNRRFQLRTSAREEALIRTAAERQGVTITDFIMAAAREKAAESLNAQTEFVFAPEAWKKFLQMLDRPPVDKPRLRRLFAEPGIAKRRE